MNASDSCAKAPQYFTKASIASIEREERNFSLII